MKSWVVVFFTVVIASCSNSGSLKEFNTSFNDAYTIDQRIVLDTAEYLFAINEIEEEYFLEGSFCILKNDTLNFYSTKPYGYGSQYFWLKIAGGGFDSFYNKSECLRQPDYLPLDQQLILSSGTFHVGDSLTLKIYFKGISENPNASEIDTVEMDGLFKVLIYDSSFSYAQFREERNHRP